MTAPTRWFRENYERSLHYCASSTASVVVLSNAIEYELLRGGFHFFYRQSDSKERTSDMSLFSHLIQS